MYVVDTGPVLKFFATNTERWLFAALAHHPIHAPDAVRDEVFAVPRRRPQFERAPQMWQKVEHRFIIRLCDDLTPALADACRSVLGQDLDAVKRQSADLGERMALLHTSVKAQEGEHVVLLCDDGPAQALIRREAARLTRLGATGTVAVADTLLILEWAIQAGAVPSRVELRKAYARMADVDESLPKSINRTALLGSPPWPP